MTTGRRHQPEAGGFTLIELVIGMALGAMVLASAYLCLNAGFAGQKMIEPRVEIFQNARVAMSIMTADLRAACPLSKEQDFLGMPRSLGDVEADNLDFGTHNYSPRRADEGDFCQESLFLDRDMKSGQFVLYRRRNPRLAVDELSGGSREEIARGLLGLKFEFYDGLDWYTSWGDTDGKGKRKTSERVQPNLTGLPDAVRITLLFDSNPRASAPNGTEPAANRSALVFQTVARLELASASRESSSGGQSAAGNSTGGAPNPGSPNGAPN